MKTKTMKWGLAAASVLLAGITAPTVQAAPQATGTAAQVMGLSDADVAALEANFSTSRKVLTQHDGQQIYQATCQGCHMPQGQGANAVGFYPALAGNPKLAAGAYATSIVMTGLHGMPSFADRMDNQQIADVVNYVRSHFGNHYTDAIKPEDVQALRQ